MKINIEKLEKHKKPLFYIGLFLCLIILYYSKKNILVSVLLAYLTDEILKNCEEKMKSQSFSNISIILGILISVVGFACKNSSCFLILIFLLFSKVFLSLLVFLLSICFIWCFCDYNNKIKDRCKKFIAIVTGRYTDENSDYLNEFKSSIFINSIIIVFLVFLVASFQNSIVSDLITEDYILSYLSIFIVKLLNFLKKEILKIS